MVSISAELSCPAYSDLGPDEGLEPIFAAGTSVTRETWEETLRPELLTRWNAVLGHPAVEDFDRTPMLREVLPLPDCEAGVYELPTGPRTRQLVFLLQPRERSQASVPGAVVPYYTPGAMAGFDLSSRTLLAEETVIQFGLHLVQQGYLVVCGQAFPYNTVPEPRQTKEFACWHAGTARVLAENPDWTGMGKLVWDTRLLTDVLLAQPRVDADRIVAIGHSLGGKMAFYAGCLDGRIKAIIASDFGIGFSFTNWDAPWYLGPKAHDPALGLAHHHLLALQAPRPFLLVAGSCDGPASWQYLNKARSVYALYGREDALGLLDHASGHSPPPAAMRTAYRWLAEQFGLPERPFRI